jgi:hypothetical protein
LSGNHNNPFDNNDFPTIALAAAHSRTSEQE